MARRKKQVKKYDKYIYNFRKYYLDMLKRREIGKINYRNWVRDMDNICV